jgi:translation initiation factor IF-3
MNKYDKSPQKNQTQQKVVELRFHKNIAEHDLEIKARKIEQALLKKNQVKLRLQLMGRERSHPEQGVEWLTKLVERFSEISTSNRKPTYDNLVVILFPKK